MIETRKTEIFAKWLDGLGDIRARTRILARIERLSFGNPGDVKAVGEGVSELRIDYGPGYRVYYKKHGRKVGQKGVGFIIDEKKSHPSSCGLRLMIMDGGQGLEHMECCGHSLTLADEKPLLDLGFGTMRKKDDAGEEEQDVAGGPTGNA